MFEQFCSLPLSSFLSFSAISSFCTSAAAFTVAACIVLWVHILIIVVSGALFWFGVRPMLKLVGLAERDPSATHYTKVRQRSRRRQRPRIHRESHLIPSITGQSRASSPVCIRELARLCL